jgi:hypothetical protein
MTLKLDTAEAVMAFLSQYATDLYWGKSFPEHAEACLRIAANERLRRDFDHRTAELGWGDAEDIEEQLRAALEPK